MNAVAIGVAIAVLSYLSLAKSASRGSAASTVLYRQRALVASGIVGAAGAVVMGVAQALG
jgi:hypothetical protein